MIETFAIKNVFSSSMIDEAVDVFIPEFLESNDTAISIKAAIGISLAFDISKCFLQILDDKSFYVEDQFLKNFAKNVHLLIDKTWVDSRDEFFKLETIKTLDRIGLEFYYALRHEKNPYLIDFDDFVILLNNIIYLLFGKEANRDSLIEYVVRIEPYFGFFCYYITNLKLLENIDENKARLATLIAVVFLAEF